MSYDSRCWPGTQVWKLNFGVVELICFSVEMASISAGMGHVPVYVRVYWNRCFFSWVWNHILGQETRIRTVTDGRFLKQCSSFRFCVANRNFAHAHTHTYLYLSSVARWTAGKEEPETVRYKYGNCSELRGQPCWKLLCGRHPRPPHSIKDIGWNRKWGILQARFTVKEISLTHFLTDSKPRNTIAWCHVKMYVGWMLRG